MPINILLVDPHQPINWSASIDPFVRINFATLRKARKQAGLSIPKKQQTAYFLNGILITFNT